MTWRVVYIIGKLLERQYLKWARITHLDIWNTSYGQKKGQESNWRLDFWPLKVGNWPDFRVCRRRVTYCWKTFNKGYNFASNLISIKGLHTKLWRLKVAGVLTLAISELPLWSPRTKSHLDVGPVETCKVYYKGEGGGFPQVQVVVSLVCPSCSWLVLAPKVLQLCTNHFVFILCRPMWVSKACQIVLVPSRSSNTPLNPFKVLRARECASTPCFSTVFPLGFTLESLKELGAHQWW